MSPRISSLVAAGLLAGCGSMLPDRGPSPEYAAALAPQPLPPATLTGAIYQPGSYESLVGSQRPRRVGDILTVRLVERTQASKSVASESSRSGSNQVTLPGAFPFSKIPADLFSGGTNTSFSGEGTADQQNQLSGEITVTVIGVMPNGVLAVRGEKRLTLARGDEYIRMSGLVRPADIDLDNSVPSNRVADARITYAGNGQVAAATRQGWLQRFFTAISPF